MQTNKNTTPTSWTPSQATTQLTQQLQNATQTLKAKGHAHVSNTCYQEGARNMVEVQLAQCSPNNSLPCFKCASAFTAHPKDSHGLYLGGVHYKRSKNFS